MRLEREAIAGTEERSDALVRVRPGEGLTIAVRSKSGPMYQERIEAVVRETLTRYGVGGAAVEVIEAGAYDHVIAARVEAALARATGGGEAFHQPLPLVATRQATARDRLRRSRLYVPGGNARLLAFAESFGPDCLLLDLEDAVAPGEKDAARFLVRRTLATMDFGGTELWVRINPLDRGGREDLRVVVGGRPHGVCLPKAESPVQVTELAGLLYELEGRYGLPWRLWIMPIVESPRGVLAAFDIAQASERVVCLAFGAEDYTREVGCSRSGEALLWARSHLVAAAKAAGVQASDTVFPDVEDEAGLRVETLSARNLGFDGKGVIHPLQIDSVHEVFAPSPDEVAWARGVVEAAEAAEEQGLGAVTYQGRLVDRPVLLRAKRTLAMAQALGMEVGNAG
ncbi:MAG: citrate lyase acyl carrier protein [Candidatus Acetothermia bacterium]|jgi:citrate lyase subunit beta/citryl-CoA lyase|nr:citrate lyase acyl carrier protein [Candidatus Acetothermia bacterium]